MSRVPLLIWGPPGVGKSATVVRWAEKRGLRCWTVIASLREPSDFAGLPIVSESGSVRFAAPTFAVEAAKDGGVIFLDEITTAPPAVQAALLRVVLDRCIGDLQLDPSKVAIVAAANPPSDAAGGWDLSPPLANRFAHTDYNLRSNDWVESFPSYWGKVPQLNFGNELIQDFEWSLARSVIASFIRSRPTLLLRVPSEIATRGEAWPSPRTWDFASRLLATTHPSDSSDQMDLLVSCVGEGAAIEFFAWRRELDLPDPRDLLEHPDRYKHPNRPDQAYAILSAVVQTAIQNLTERHWLAAWSILATAARSGGVDVGAAAARQLAMNRKPNLPLPQASLAPFIEMLKVAGLLG